MLGTQTRQNNGSFSATMWLIPVCDICSWCQTLGVTNEPRASELKSDCSVVDRHSFDWVLGQPPSWLKMNGLHADSIEFLNSKTLLFGMLRIVCNCPSDKDWTNHLTFASTCSKVKVSQTSTSVSRLQCFDKLAAIKWPCSKWGGDSQLAVVFAGVEWQRGLHHHHWCIVALLNNITIRFWNCP